MTLIYNHPFYIVSIFIFTFIYTVLIGSIGQVKNTIKYGFFTALLIIIINPLISQSGRTIIYKSPKIPILGKIKITAESLAFGGNMALKLFCILLIFLLYETITDRDETFSFIARYAGKTALIFSMTVNIIHRLRLEIVRVKDVMVLRGVDFNEKNLFFKRVRVYYPILKVILLSSLEGSLNRAEALYSRGYGRGRRTFYFPIKMKAIDYLFLAASTILTALVCYGLFWDMGYYDFYPILREFNKDELVHLCYIDLVLLVLLLSAWGCRKWRFSEYKI
jgi:energy-coupling factor transport system permease protein